MFLPDWLLRIADWMSPKRRRRVSLLQTAERFEPKALLSAFIVDSPIDQPDADPGDGTAASISGKTTLRAAVQEANANPGHDTIILPPGIIELSLTGPSDHSAESGDLEITDSLTIIGAGENETSIDASQIDSAFHIQDGVSLTLDNLSIQISADSETAIVNDGGSLTLNEVEVEEVVPQAIPAVDWSDVTTNERHADLLVGLFQPVVSRDEPLDAIFAPPPIYISIVTTTKPDATIAIGTERPSDWTTAAVAPALQPMPEGTPDDRLKLPVRTANQSPEIPGTITQQRRRDVVNSLYEDQSKTNGQKVQPAAGDDAGSDSAELRRMRENFPMLLPMENDGTLQVVPDDSAVDRPVPPPLPEPAQLKEAAGNTRRADVQQVPMQGMMAAALSTVVRPGAIRRAVRRITGWKNLVV